MPTLFSATPNISTFPTSDFDDGFGSFGTSSFGSSFPRPDFARRDFPKSDFSKSSTYNTKRNDDELFEAHVPLGPEFKNKPEMVNATIRGHTVTINAKMETVDSRGSKRMSKICKDVTLVSFQTYNYNLTIYIF